MSMYVLISKLSCQEVHFDAIHVEQGRACRTKTLIAFKKAVRAKLHIFVSTTWKPAIDGRGGL